MKSFRLKLLALGLFFVISVSGCACLECGCCTMEPAVKQMQKEKSQISAAAESNHQEKN